MKMNSLINRSIHLIIIIAGVLILERCSSDFTSPTSPSGNTIVGIASANDSLKAFTSALSKAGLAPNFNNVNGGQYTVFAPTNYSFVKYLRASGFTIGKVTTSSAGDSAVKVINGLTTSSAVTISALATRLNYHVISSNLPSSQISGAQGFVTWNGSRLSVSKISGATYPYILNANVASNGANIIDADKTAANGVLHVIDAVMAPLSTTGQTNSTLAWLGYTSTSSVSPINYGTVPVTINGGTTTDTNGANFNLFAAALRVTGLYAVVYANASPIPDYTVFAPTDAALIADLGAASEAAAYTAITSLTGSALSDFTDKVKYHIVLGRVLSTDLTNSQVVSSILTGKTFTVSINGSTYTLNDQNTNITDPVITGPNKLTNAGVVHVINAVLQPK